MDESAEEVAAASAIQPDASEQKGAHLQWRELPSASAT
jgi:hypothetical protein